MVQLCAVPLSRGNLLCVSRSERIGPRSHYLKHLSQPDLVPPRVRQGFLNLGLSDLADEGQIQRRELRYRTDIIQCHRNAFQSCSTILQLIEWLFKEGPSQWSSHFEQDCCATSFGHRFFYSYLGNREHPVISAQLKRAIKIFISISPDSLEYFQLKYLSEPNQRQHGARSCWTVWCEVSPTFSFHFMLTRLPFFYITALWCQDSHKLVSL